MPDIRRFKGGAVPSPLDSRDYQIKDLIAGASAPVAEAYQNQLGWEVPIFDQKQSNECVGCSLATTRWITEKTQSGNTELFSPSFIYFNRDPETDYCGEGMQPRQALKHLKDDGVCFYSSLPGFYLYSEVDTIKKIVDSKKDEAKPYRISSFYSVPGKIEIQNTIKTLGSVSAMIPLYDCVYDCPSDGNVIYDSKNPGQDYGFHQIVIFGWDETGWLCINSWGTEWGFNGRFHIPFNFPIQEAWAIVDNIEEINQPRVSSQYEDIKGHWNENLMKKAIDDGIMVGYVENGKAFFKPDGPITRCEALTLAYRLGGLGEKNLPDVY